MTSENINDLFQEVADDGDLSGKSLQILTGPALGQQMQAALGVSVDDVGAADDVVVVGILIDDSGSLMGSENAVREGHNLIVDALGATKQANSILMSTRYMCAAQKGIRFNHPDAGILYPFNGVANAIRMDSSNYAANGSSTPLYDQSIALLGSVVAKVQEFAKQGISARSITLIVTDGGDNDSNHGAEDVKSVISDMLMTEKHIISFLGIGQESFFRTIAGGMGIPDNWVLTTGTSASEVRQAFRLFSQSATRASQSAATFSTNASFW